MSHYLISDLFKSAQNQVALYNSIYGKMNTTGQQIMVLLNTKTPETSEVKELTEVIFAFLKETASGDVGHSLILKTCVQLLSDESRKDKKVEPISTKTIVQCIKDLNNISLITATQVNRMRDLFHKALYLLPKNNLVTDAALHTSDIISEEGHRLQGVKKSQSRIYFFNT